jgi:hypothetical protein
LFELTKEKFLNPITMQRLTGMAKHSLKKKVIASGNKRSAARAKS